MKILIVTPYRDFSGGVESVNQMLQTIFEEDGHQVDYLTADGPMNIFTRTLKRVIGLPAVTAFAFRKIKASDYDLVIANGEFAWGINHPNAICVFHGSYQGIRDHLRRYLSVRQYVSLSWHAHIQRRAARKKCVVAVSHFVEEILRRQGIRVSTVISNCVDTASFQPGQNVKTKPYLFVGTYHRYGKGFDVLEALARKGLSIDCMTNIPPGQGLGFLNVVARSKMPEVYKRYRMLIFPSRFEAVGLVPLEAMSSGLPIVMVDVGIGTALKDLIPEFVIEAAAADLPAAFAERIALIEGRYDEFACRAREYVLAQNSYQQFKEQWRSLVRVRMC